jgi:hypothetical protein
MTWGDITRKFVNCVSVAAKPVSETRARGVQQAVFQLESEADAAGLLRSLA